jgi:hypothetical protein
MNLENEAVLEVSFTYLYPMREDNPMITDFVRRWQEVEEIMGHDYPPQLITRIGTILSSNGIRHSHAGIIAHDAVDETGQIKSTKAITFEAPLSAKDISNAGYRIGPVAARALLEFAIRLQARCEAGQTPRQIMPTSTN